jgi:hypothetical protein
MDSESIHQAHELVARAQEQERRMRRIWRVAALVIGIGIGALRGLVSVEGDAASGAVGYVIGYATATGLMAVVLVSVMLALFRR